MVAPPNMHIASYDTGFWRVSELTHAYALGGAVADAPSNPSEDAMVWLARERVFVAASGHGYADGLESSYSTSAPLCRTLLGVIAGALAPQAAPRADIRPSEAAATVRRAWDIGARFAHVASGGLLRTVKNAMTELLDDVLARAYPERAPSPDLIVARPTDLAVLRFGERSVAIEHCGALHVVVCRRGRMRVLVPAQTLGAQAAAAGTSVPSTLEHVVVGGIGMVRDKGQLRSDWGELPTSLDWTLEPADKIGVLNDGAWSRTSRKAIERALAEGDLELLGSEIAVSTGGAPHHAAAAFLEVG